MHDEKRLPLFLLNNLLGGPGMNNRLNVSLREKNGLVYNVESNVTSYTDTGLAMHLLRGLIRRTRRRRSGLFTRNWRSCVR